jgi:chromosome segregation ATPase
LEADIRGHIRLEHEMKIHMDYLEAKVEKFEKEQKAFDVDMGKLNRQVASLTEKLQLIRDDRDDKDRQLKKIKSINDNLR